MIYFAPVRRELAAKGISKAAIDALEAIAMAADKAASGSGASAGDAAAFADLQSLVAQLQTDLVAAERAASDAPLLAPVHYFNPDDVKQVITDPSSPVNIGTLLDSISSTQGSVLYRGATTWSGLGPGTAGQFLKTQGAGADPAWATPASTSGGTNTTLIGDFSKWTAAKARGSTSPARFAILGDSNVAGQGSASGTAGLTGGWASSFSQTFAALAGFQSNSFFGDQNIPVPVGVALNTYDPRMTLGSGWASDSSATNQIAGGRFICGNAGATGKLRFTPANAFSKFRLWYATNPGLNTAVTVSVDGTLVDTINQSAAASLTFKDYAVTAGTHFIEIGAGASGVAFIAGIETWNGTATPTLHQLGFAGAKAADLNFAAQPWNSRPALVTMAEDYVIIYDTINDPNLNTALDIYYANIEALVAAISPTTNGLLCVGYPPNASNILNGYLENLARALRNIAQDYNWSFYDLRSDLGHSNARANALGYRYDDLHPNASGHSTIASKLYAFLSANGL